MHGCLLLKVRTKTERSRKSCPTLESTAYKVSSTSCGLRSNTFNVAAWEKSGGQEITNRRSLPLECCVLLPASPQ